MRLTALPFVALMACATRSANLSQGSLSQALPRSLPAPPRQLFGIARGQSALRFRPGEANSLSLRMIAWTIAMEPGPDARTE